jgi:hypothetical protein
MTPDAVMPHSFSPDSHIAAARLAALADESPTASEAHHLAACATCADEVAAYQALLAMTRSERDRLGQPLTAWTTLASALERADLLDATTGTRAPGLGRLRPRWPRATQLRQGAAAALLVAAGAVAGRLSAVYPQHSAPPQTSAAGENAVSSRVIEASNAPISYHASDTMAIQSRDEAYTTLKDAEARYRHAVAYLMESDSGALNESREGYRTRLAALNEVEHTIKAALTEAQDDPVLNQWYISTVGARQATLRELGQAIPVDEKRHRY